jgi:two-component system, sensor histidine kinase
MLTATAELARSALDAAPDAMIIIDDTGTVRYANRQVTALFGREHEEVVGHSVEQLMPGEFRSRHVAHRDSYVHQPRARPMGPGQELFGQRKDGSVFPVEISLSPIQDAQRTLVAAAIRDVSDRKRAERELLLARENAERARESADQLREVADRARAAADHARESAVRANQAKSRFLATASHDLRQPLQTLALLGGTLRRTVSDQPALEALTLQEQAIGAMSRLLNALLDISKLESGAIKPELSDFRVAELFDGLRREFAALAANKGLELQVETSDERVHSDRALVEQIMKNLVSNAIKYTRAGYVRLRSSRERATVRLDVLDSGIGIPAEQIGYIYDEFYQVGVAANSSRDGYGLGLSIVQRLANLLDIKLDVRSEVGRGSVFSVLVPKGRRGRGTPAAQPVPAAVSVPRKSSPLVLLVEDDPAVSNATCMLLRVEGYRVTAVASLSEALASLKQGTPDLVITDYHLRAGELGTQVIASLRQKLGGSLNAVLVTGDTSTAVKELPCDAHLRLASKPVNADELLGQLKSLLDT